MKNIKFALLNIRKNFKNEKQLKSAFAISVVGMLVNNMAFVFIWYYFGKTVGVINGWEPLDIFCLYGINATSYGIITTFLAGLFEIPTYITTGNMDKYFLTPKSILLKISTSKISTSGLGDLAFGVTCFIIYTTINKLTLFQIGLALLMIVVASIVFYAFSLICMTISFYLMDGHNVSHGLYGLFLSTSLYHGGAFTGVLRFLFTFIVPSLLLGAIPVEIIKCYSLNNLLIIICLTVIWLLISVGLFYKSLRKYESNNFFGFGG